MVRVGLDCDGWHKDFEFQVGVSAVDGKTAIVKGLYREDGAPRFTRAHHDAIIAALKSPLPAFQDVDWERVSSSPNPVTAQQE